MSIWSLLGHILLFLLALIVLVSFVRRPLFFGQDFRLFLTHLLSKLPWQKQAKKAVTHLLSKLPWQKQAKKADDIPPYYVIPLSKLTCPDEASNSQKKQSKKEANKSQKLPWQKQAKKADNILADNILPYYTIPLSELTCPDEANKYQKNQAKKEAKNQAKKEANRSQNNHEKKAGNIVRAGIFRPDLHGMDDYEIKVIDFLEHGTEALLGIHGVRGIGKTTLLELVWTSYRQHSSPFRYVFISEAGNGFTVDMLRGDLASHVGLDPMASVDLISDFLEDKSFILLLDDVWASFDLAAAGLPKTLGPRQKVIFTTRNESICAEMGCAGNTIRMYTLVGDVAWNLFKYNAGDIIIDSDPEIKYLAKQMVAECRGFPSALRTVGLSMSTKKDLKEWIYAHEMLIKGSLANEIEDSDNEGYPRLQFFEDVF